MDGVKVFLGSGVVFLGSGVVFLELLKLIFTFLFSRGLSMIEITSSSKILSLFLRKLANVPSFNVSSILLRFCWRSISSISSNILLISLAKSLSAAWLRPKISIRSLSGLGISNI